MPTNSISFLFLLCACSCYNTQKTNFYLAFSISNGNFCAYFFRRWLKKRTIKHVFICFLPPFLLFSVLGCCILPVCHSAVFFFNYNTGQSSLIISLQHHSLESAPLWREVNIFGALQLQLCSFNVVIDTRILFFL